MTKSTDALVRSFRDTIRGLWIVTRKMPDDFEVVEYISNDCVTFFISVLSSQIFARDLSRFYYY